MVPWAGMAPQALLYHSWSVFFCCSVVYYDDPLRLIVPYNYFLARLKRPHDGFMKSAFALILTADNLWPHAPLAEHILSTIAKSR